jgi:putative oxidoreductase
MDRTVRALWPLPLRIVLAVGFVYHGLPKLGAAGHASFAGMLRQLGIPLPELAAWAIGLLEVLGGIALLVGFLTALAAALLAIEMIVAMLEVHLPYGFGFLHITGMTPQGPVLSMPGIEVNLLYLAALLALFLGGPGPLSVDEGVLGPGSRVKPPWLRARTATA